MFEKILFALLDKLVSCAEEVQPKKDTHKWARFKLKFMFEILHFPFHRAHTSGEECEIQLV